MSLNGGKTIRARALREEEVGGPLARDLQSLSSVGGSRGELKPPLWLRDGPNLLPLCSCGSEGLNLLPLVQTSSASAAPAGAAEPNPEPRRLA
jgi:hypothetical protein